MKRILLPILLLFLLGACQPQPEQAGAPPPKVETSPPVALEETGDRPTQPASQTGSEGAYPEILEKVVRDLALRLDADLNAIGVLSIQGEDWPDAGLDCGLPGVEYAQVVTPGYLIQLAYQDAVYTYHTNQLTAFFLCQGGSPEPPLFPVDPDEIQDGIPWMPVDPPPTIAPGDTLADPDPVK